MRVSQLCCESCGGLVEDGCGLCPYCGIGVRFAGTVPSARRTELACPSCGTEEKLHELTYRGLQIDVCPRCEGSWYDLGELEGLVTRARRDTNEGTFEPSMPAATTSAAIDGCASSTRPAYLRCPHCSQLMSRQNFEKRSGVLIDWCVNHGFWLDGGELQRVRTWAAQNPDGPPPPLAQPERPTVASIPAYTFGSSTMYNPQASLVLAGVRLLARLIFDR